MELLEKYPPATENEIAVAEQKMGKTIPKVYKEFLRNMNGASLNECVFYDTESMVEMYECNEFGKYAPDYLSIGNDNGDREIIMKAEEDF